MNSAALNICLFIFSGKNPFGAKNNALIFITIFLY